MTSETRATRQLGSVENEISGSIAEPRADWPVADTAPCGPRRSFGQMEGAGGGPKSIVRVLAPSLDKTAFDRGPSVGRPFSSPLGSKWDGTLGT